MKKRLPAWLAVGMVAVVMVLWGPAPGFGKPAVSEYRIQRKLVKGPSGDGVFEVTLSFHGKIPSVAGIVEHLPQGAIFPEKRVDISTAAYFRLDREKGRIAFTILDGKPVRYRVHLPEPDATISGRGVALFWQEPGEVHGSRSVPVTGDGSSGTGVTVINTDNARNDMSTPSSARIPCDDGDGTLTARELADGICGYLLGKADDALEDLLDAAHVYRAWGGRPKTIRDMNNRRIVLHRPVKRIITTNPDNSLIAIALGCGDRIVGTDECTVGSCICPRMGFGEKDAKAAPRCWSGVCGGRLDEIEQTSTRHTVNYELMAALNPDVVLETLFWARRADLIAERVGAPVVVAGVDFNVTTWYDQIRILGELLDREEKAAVLIAFCQEKIRSVTAVTRNLSPHEKPRVYFAPRGARKGFYDPKEGRDFTRTYKIYDPIELAGGLNAAREVAGGNVNVSLEQIVAWDPEVILLACSAPGDNGVDFILDAAHFKQVSAVRNKRVFNVLFPHCRGRPIPRNLVNILLFAKLLHPDRFEDLDIEKEGNEIYRAFYSVDGVFSEYAAYLEFSEKFQRQFRSGSHRLQ